jgi:hypothetical protein
MVVMNHDNIARFIDLENTICKFLVHVVIVRPTLKFYLTIRRVVLFVVEEGIEIVFGKSSPFGLILQA